MGLIYTLYNAKTNCYHLLKLFVKVAETIVLKVVQNKKKLVSNSKKLWRKKISFCQLMSMTVNVSQCQFVK